MLFIVIPILSLLTAEASHNVDLSSVLNIFGTPDNPAVPCITPEGKTGECVPYYNCRTVNKTVLTNGEGVIDVRYDINAPCKSVLQSCCLIPDVTTTPKPTVTLDRGCGYRNPVGVDLKTTGDVNGETKFAEFPWMCGILINRPVDPNQPDGQQLQTYIGGGSLIHPSIVLTAAHCAVKSPRMKVRAGEWDTQDTNEPHPYQERAVQIIEIHQDFQKGSLFNDIALLFLVKPMDLAPNVALACLPPPPMPPLNSIQRVPAGTRCFATGWGKDKFQKDAQFQVILKKVEVPVVSHDTCQVQLRKTRLRRFFELHKSFMCAGGEPGKDTCTGDGGSPLVCPIEFEEGRYMQSGIVAWGIGCGTPGVPGVYVDVAYLRKWVDDKVIQRGYDPKAYTF